MTEQREALPSEAVEADRPERDQHGSLLTEGSELEPAADSPRRLWTPWRMPYVGGAREASCIFCHRLQENDDARTLILHRGDLVFVIMNLFPYNTGHVMIVPIEHVASPEDADESVLAALAIVRAPLMRALRRALSADGFNVGMNVGAVAGAGVADHFHEHVVPRWEGDANFMPILAATMVIPELIPVTYAKLRAELARELTGSAEATVVVMARDGRGVLTRGDGALPVVTAASGEPLWRAVLHATEELGAERPEILGWADDEPANAEAMTLAVRADMVAARIPPDYRLTAADELARSPIAPAVRAARRLIVSGGQS